MSLQIPNYQDPLIIPTVTPTQEGTVTPAMLAQFSGGAPTSLIIYSNTTRPAANAVGAVLGVKAVSIWNSDDNAPNFSNGVNWYDAVGNLT